MVMRKILALLLAAAVLWLAWPAGVALAQGPTNLCVNTGSGWTDHFDYNFLVSQNGFSLMTVGVATDQWEPPLPNTFFNPACISDGADVGYYDAAGFSGRPYGGTGCYMDIVRAINQNIQIRLPITRTSNATWQSSAGYGELRTVPDFNTGGNFNVSYYAVSGTENLNIISGAGGGAATALILDKATANSDYDVNIARVRYDCGSGYYAEQETPPTPVALTCSTVSDPHFETGEPWTLAGTAAVTNSLATLSTGDAVAQNVTLDANITYNSVISISRVTAPAALDVSLGEQVSTVDVAAAGWYTVSFLTAEGLAGPIEYRLTNAGPGELDIDYTCLVSSGGNCLAPNNGEFTSADFWYWFRGAGWNAPTESALLPYNPGTDGDKALILSTSTYSLPTPATGQYLLLGYEANSQAGQAAEVTSKIGAIETAQNIYSTPYQYEVDISSLAGQNVDVAFSNSGSTATDSVLVDNVCIYLSAATPIAPTPVTPIVPVNFNFGYTCADTASLMAGYGINIYNQSAIYQAGVSVWEPSGYIPWLASALWVHVGAPVTCILIEIMRLMAALTQQIINVFLNFINWLRQSAQSAIYWQHAGGELLRDTMANAVGYSRATAAGWLNWAAYGWRVSMTMLNQNFQRLGLAWGQFAGWLDEMFGWRLTEQTHEAVNAFLAVWNDSLAPYLAAGGGISQEPPSPLPVVSYALGGLLDSWNLLLALGRAVWWGVQWYFGTALGYAKLPVEMYQSFNNGLASPGFTYLLSCSSLNFWCVFLAGLQLVNQTAGETVMYPIIIVAIVIGTLMIIYTNIKKMALIDFT